MGFTLEDTRRTNCYRNTESLPYSTDIDAHFDGWVAVRGHFVKEEWETFFVVDADTAGLFPVICQPGAVEQDVLRLKVTNRDGAIAEQIEKEAYNTTDTYEIIVHDYSIHSFFSQNQEVYKGQSEQTYSGYIAKVTLAA